MTRAEVLAEISALGFHASFDRESGEFRVAPGFIRAGGRGSQAFQEQESERGAYYTNDKADALATAKDMHKRGFARLK